MMLQLLRQGFPNGLPIAASLLLLQAPALQRSQGQKREPQTKSYAVVVNPKNRYGARGHSVRNLVRDLYLKKSRLWGGSGLRAHAFGRSGGSKVQRAFEARILGMSRAALTRHWLRIKSRDGSTPPRSVRSVRLLKKYLLRYPGGFGLMTLTEAKSSGLRILMQF